MNNTATMKINGCKVAIGNERNLLELIRKIGIDMPTFCYHSELSIYGACRLCLVEVVGKGIMAACSTKPEAGMEIYTDSKDLRMMRKINVELLLANHKRECPSCSRSSSCTLQDLARRLSVTEVRYKQPKKDAPLDFSSPSLVRDPNKCVLCGDCVRVCSEVQGIGAIDFAARGANARVVPAFDKDLNEVECVNCGQCAAVCPTGAITPNQQREEVWAALHDKSKTVVVSIAPAVRVALGEAFGIKAGENVAGKLVTALRLMGFEEVYDTSFTADMTIFEEATEFLERLEKNQSMPMFTSCCPGWVKFAEVYYPDMLPHLSSTRSPQQIFGSVARDTLPQKLNVDPKDLVVVSIMPCTAKKYEAQLPKFSRDGRPDIDYVLTTTEIAQMISSMGIRLEELPNSAFDMPYGFATGGGVIFGTTGGVMEAALRYAKEKVENKPLTDIDFQDVRGTAPRKEAEVEVGDAKLRVAVVHGLGNARKLLDDIIAGRAQYDFVEVMACPGGCVCGGGQPITHNSGDRLARAAGLYNADKMQQLQKPQDNHLVVECYKEYFGGHPGSHEAHEELHTRYQGRGQIFDAQEIVLGNPGKGKVDIVVTVHTRSFRSEHEEAVLAAVVDYIKKNDLRDRVVISAAFDPREALDKGVLVMIGSTTCEYNLTETDCEKVQGHAEFKRLLTVLDRELGVRA